MFFCLHEKSNGFSYGLAGYPNGNFCPFTLGLYIFSGCSLLEQYNNSRIPEDSRLDLTSPTCIRHAIVKRHVSGVSEPVGVVGELKRENGKRVHILKNRIFQN